MDSILPKIPVIYFENVKNYLSDNENNEFENLQNETAIYWDVILDSNPEKILFHMYLNLIFMDVTDLMEYDIKNENLFEIRKKFDKILEKIDFNKCYDMMHDNILIENPPPEFILLIQKYSAFSWMQDGSFIKKHLFFEFVKKKELNVTNVNDMQININIHDNLH